MWAFYLVYKWINEKHDIQWLIIDFPFDEFSDHNPHTRHGPVAKSD